MADYIKANSSTVKTVSGIQFDLLNPRIEKISINDIAHHLSNICRFNGGTNRFYSVAHHCLFCTLLASKKAKQENRSCYETNKLVLATLLHDAAEAYVGDVITPVKSLIEGFKQIEESIQSAIYEKFNLQLSKPDKSWIKTLDLEAYAIEDKILVDGKGDLADLKFDSLRDISFDAAAIKTEFELCFSILLCRWQNTYRQPRIQVPSKVSGAN